MKIKISLKTLCFAVFVLAIVFAAIGVARRNSLRYRSEKFASLNAATLPADLSGDYVWRYHIGGGWDTKLTLKKDGTFTTVQEKGGQYLAKGSGTYSIDGRVVSLRYRNRSRGWNSFADFKWAVMLNLGDEVVMVPDRSCNDFLVGEQAAEKAGALSCMNYLTREESIEEVLPTLQTFIRENLASTQ